MNSDNPDTRARYSTLLAHHDQNAEVLKRRVMAWGPVELMAAKQAWQQCLHDAADERSRLLFGLALFGLAEMLHRVAGREG